MGRAPCCDKANVKKGPWSPEEDAKLKSYIEQHGTGGNWIALPQKIGLKRCGKSCRLRWLNYLRPNIKHGGFSEEEDRIICSLYVSIGSRWSIIAAQLPGRTDNDIKNYWNTRLKKKLFGKQRKEHQTTRRGNALKQMQMKRENIASYGTGNGSAVYSVSEAPGLPYWPQFAATSQYGGADQASIRKLLNKLGGRFSGDEQVLVDNGFSAAPPLQPDIASSDISSIEALCKMGSPFTEGNMYNNNGCGNLPILEGQSSQMGDVQSFNMAYHDPTARRSVYGLEFLFGDEMVTAATDGDRSSEFGEIGSLICPSNYEEMLQGFSEEYSNFSEARVSGGQ